MAIDNGETYRQMMQPDDQPAVETISTECQMNECLDCVDPECACSCLHLE